MDNIIKIINDAEHIAILSHIDEDCDAFGSSLAILEILKSKEKDVTYFLSKQIEHRLEFLGGDYTIYDEAKDYGSFDLVICLDSGDIKRLGKRVKILNNAKKSINIDHHYTNTMYADINIVKPDMSSTGELVYDLFIATNQVITEKIAKYLYCSIMSDTGCLKYSSATAKTLRTVASLMEKGIDHAELSRLLFDTEKIEAVKIKGAIMNSIESYFDGLLSLVCVDDEMFSKYNINESDVSDIVNIPRAVEGTEIAVALRKINDKIKISLRSNGKYNVGEISLKLGGGGHKMAAGAMLRDVELDDAKKRIIEIIGEYINDRI